MPHTVFSLMFAGLGVAKTVQQANVKLQKKLAHTQLQAAQQRENYLVTAPDFPLKHSKGRLLGRFFTRYPWGVLSILALWLLNILSPLVADFKRAALNP